MPGRTSPGNIAVGRVRRYPQQSGKKHRLGVVDSLNKRYFLGQKSAREAAFPKGRFIEPLNFLPAMKHAHHFHGINKPYHGGKSQMHDRAGNGINDRPSAVIGAVA